MTILEATSAVLVLAIDPGPEKSAWVLFDGERVVEWAKDENNDLRSALADEFMFPKGTYLAIEKIASYGMAVGAEVFATCIWIGRFMEAWGAAAELITRKSVALHVCNSPRANDPTIRAALIDRWGGKAKAIGRKKTPGPLYGVKADGWAALALAITAFEQNFQGRVA